MHIEEEPKDKVPNVEDFTVLKEFDNLFKEILRFPSKRDIDFYIKPMPGETPISKTPYRMITS
jgi:hypothetical protein